MSEPDDSQTEEQQQTVSNVNNDQGGGGSNKLNVNTSEKAALRAKDELLREGRKRGFDGFTPEEAAEIENMKKPMDIMDSYTEMRDLP